VMAGRVGRVGRHALVAHRGGGALPGGRRWRIGQVEEIAFHRLVDGHRYDVSFYMKFVSLSILLGRGMP
jgi:hypothetical protein